MIIVHALMQIKPDQEEAFLKSIQGLIQATRQEEGSISYELLKSLEQEHTYTMVELWKDLAAAQSHNTSEHFTAFVQEAKALLAAPMGLKVFNGEPLQA